MSDHVFNPLSHLKGDADEVEQEFQNIEKKNGMLTAEAVVDHAKKPTSCIHRFFEWDEAAAAHQYRLQQARHLIASVRVVLSRDQENKPSLVKRAYISAKDEDGQRAYRRPQELQTNPAMYASALKDVWGQLIAIRRRYHEISELEPIWDYIDEHTQEITEKITTS